MIDETAEIGVGCLGSMLGLIVDMILLRWLWEDGDKRRQRKARRGS